LALYSHLTRHGPPATLTARSAGLAWAARKREP